MQKEFTFKEIYNVIENLEITECLFSKKIVNVYFWKIIKYELINGIFLKAKITQKAHDIKVTKFDALKTIFLASFKNIFKNNKNQKEIILFDADRFFYDNYKCQSIYLFKMIEEFKNNSINYEIIYPLFISKKYEPINVYNNENFKYLFYKLKVFFKSKICTSKLSRYETKHLKYLRDFLEKKTGINEIEILHEKTIIKKLINFIEEYKYYENYFKIKSPKQIYIICSYGREAIISAAQDLGIEVIELQHGVFTKYHLGYNFPRVHIPYFPNKLMIFGEYWRTNANLPINTEICLYGYPYLRFQLNKYKNIKNKKNQIIFVSQGTIGKKLSEIALKFALDNPNIKVIYRLHPGEFLRWKTEYNLLYENRNLNNIEISDNNDKNLYEFLLESEYLIGVYSTVIYEALEIGIKIGILKLFGYESVEDLVEKNYIYQFNDNEKIELNKLDDLKKMNNGYIFMK